MRIDKMIVAAEIYDHPELKWVVISAKVSDLIYIDFASSEEEALAMVERSNDNVLQAGDHRAHASIRGLLYRKRTNGYFDLPETI